MKKKLIAGIIFLIMCITSTLIYAAIDAKVEMNPSSGEVKPGDEVTFTIKVKDIVSENGANGIEGTISYDTDKFEELKFENVTKAGSWDVAYYNGKVIAEGLSAIKDDSDVINIKLKIKDDESLIGKTANVSFNNIVVYNTDKIDLGTVSASVKIEGESGSTTPDGGNENTPTPDGGDDTEPTPSNKPGGTNPTGTPTATAKPNSGNTTTNTPITNIDTNTSSGNNTSNSGSNSSSKGNSSAGSTTINGSTTSSSSLPKAGIGSAIAVLTVAAAGLGTVAYIKLRKYREI